MNHFRKKRLFIHKGNLRNKWRLPRKMKKQNKKRLKKEINAYINNLKKLHGNIWSDYFITGE